MKRLVTTAMVLMGISGSAIAQAPRPPQVLPTTVLDPASARPVGPLSPSEAVKQRDAIMKALKEDLRSFDPGTVSARQVDGRWQVRAGSELLKDFGPDRGAAFETARAIQDMGITQVGIVPGARPEFVYWLTNGKAPRGTNSQVVVIPVSARSVRAEQVGGTWVVTDGTKGLYDFGTDAEAARRAAVVFWKYGFNQLGIVGGPHPAMVYPLADPRQAALDKVAPVPNPSPIGVLQDVTRTSLLLPGNVYGGPKSSLDVTKLEVVRRGEWLLVHGDDVLGRFGSVEFAARGAMKALQDARATEWARLGDSGFPLFLANGQPIRGEPLAAAKTSFHGDRLKVQKVRDTWWVFEENRPVLEAGTKGDAELIVQVIRLYDLRVLCVFGQKETGLKLLTAGR
jgi:hypothetical protein